MKSSTSDAGPERSAQTETLELRWGIASIAAFIGRTPRQTYEALIKGELPARQVNGRWVASDASLRTHFEGPSSQDPSYD